jgi:hypothetical protein
MPRGAISEQVLNTRTGLAWPSAETTGDPANGHFFVWSPRKVLLLRNTSGTTAYNVTFTPRSDNLDVFVGPPKVISVPFGVSRMFGPFPSLYMHPEDGDGVYVDVANAALVLKIYNVAEG